MITKKMICAMFALGSMFFVQAHQPEESSGSVDQNEVNKQQEPITISFTLNAKGGEQGMRYFQIMLSKDFKGEATVRNVNRADWIDLTDRFTLPELERGTEEKAVFSKVSGDISDLLTPGQTYTIAFRQIVKDQTVHGAQSQIRIRNFQLAKGTEGTGTVVLDHAKAGWSLYTKGKLRPNRPNISDSQLVLRGNHGKAVGYLQVETDAWVVSTPQIWE